MKQNIFDDEQFFQQYSQMREHQAGLNEVLEEPAMKLLLPNVTGMKVLDIGCGSGRMCRYLASQGAASILGIDISERMLSAARSETDKQTNISYQAIAVEDFDAAAGSYDLVLSSLTFHYIADYGRVVGKMVQWLKAGGYCVFSVEHPVSTAMLAGWCKDEHGNKLHWPCDDYFTETVRERRWYVDGVIKYHRTLETTINVLLNAGLRILRINEPSVTLDQVGQRPDLEDERRRPVFLLISSQKTEP